VSSRRRNRTGRGPSCKPGGRTDGAYGDHGAGRCSVPWYIEVQPDRHTCGAVRQSVDISSTCWPAVRHRGYRQPTNFVRCRAACVGPLKQRWSRGQTIGTCLEFERQRCAGGTSDLPRRCILCRSVACTRLFASSPKLRIDCCDAVTLLATCCMFSAPHCIY